MDPRCSVAACADPPVHGTDTAHGAAWWTTPGYPQEGRTTNPKKAGSPASEWRAPVFGIRSRAETRIGRLTFGFRRRTVQYVLIV